MWQWQKTCFCWLVTAVFLDYKLQCRWQKQGKNLPLHFFMVKWNHYTREVKWNPKPNLWAVKWLNKITVLLWILNTVFIYLLLPQSITLRGFSKTKKLSFTNAWWKYFKHKSDLWHFKNLDNNYEAVTFRPFSSR